MIYAQFPYQQQLLRHAAATVAPNLTVSTQSPRGGSMRRLSFVVLTGTLLAAMSAGANADDTADLIAQDKAWGTAGTKGDADAVAKLLADNVVSVSETGIRGKQAEIADTRPAPAGTQYEPTDYKVTFLDADTAVMTHSTKGDEAHHSLHVWSRKGGQWQIVATSSTPIKQ